MAGCHFARDDADRLQNGLRLRFLESHNLENMCWIDRIQGLKNLNSEDETVHYWLRLIESGQLRFWNFVFHFMGKCHFHFLIN